MAAVTPRYRIAVANRVIAAVAGGYAVAAMVSVAGAFAGMRWLAMGRADAVTTAMWVAIPALPVTAMACVWARSGARAWSGVAIACLALGAVAVLAGWRP